MRPSGLIAWLVEDQKSFFADVHGLVVDRPGNSDPDVAVAQQGRVDGLAVVQGGRRGGPGALVLLDNSHRLTRRDRVGRRWSGRDNGHRGGHQQSGRGCADHPGCPGT